MSNWDDSLNKIVQEVQSLSGLPKATTKRVATKIGRLIDQQFDDGVDPYGEPWAPKADGSPSHLDDTGDMRASVDVSAQGTEVTASIDDPFPFHEAGTANMPARPILPYKGTPPAWEDAVDEAVNEELEASELFKA